MKNKLLLQLFLIPAVALLPASLAAKATDMISVSADIVEISGSIESSVGFSWFNVINFAEKEIPGVLEVGSFERQTALATVLNLMENESKAQVLSNPKIVTKNGVSANISVGGSIPLPEVNNQGVGTNMYEYGIILNVHPTIIKEKGNLIDLQVNMEVSAPDFSRTIGVGATTVPSINKRTIQTRVELNSGETLVIGGLKSSQRDVAVSRVPFFGKLPVIGLLFRSKHVVEDQRSLFLFVTVEIVE